MEFLSTGEVDSGGVTIVEGKHPKNGLFGELGRDVDQRRFHRQRFSSFLEIIISYLVSRFH